MMSHQEYYNKLKLDRYLEELLEDIEEYTVSLHNTDLHKGETYGRQKLPEM